MSAVLRDRFSRGLVQPEGEFRFGLDALLLACFPDPTLFSCFITGAVDLDCGLNSRCYTLRIDVLTLKIPPRTWCELVLHNLMP